MSPDDRNLILSVNAGSSSLKISVFLPIDPSVASPTQNVIPNSNNSNHEPLSLLFTSSIDSLTALPARFTFKAHAPDISSKQLKKQEIEEIKDHDSAFQYFLKFLEQNTRFDKSHVKHICHRVVHGGDYPGPVLISSESYHHIESLSDLAPLHNGRALAVIESCIKILPDSESIAFFDSMFHSTLPDYIAKYAIDQSVAGPKGLRKYGFHGLSYSFILRSVANYLRKPISSTNLVVMHLGSGASVCAIKDGQSLDTSMGLTPLDGLPGATRSGHVDPSLIFHYTSTASRLSRQAAEAVEITDAEEILNKEAGWKSLAGTTDFAVIAERAGQEQYPNETLAFNMLVDRIINYVGSYLLKLGGPRAVDALVFSGGIGEASVKLRREVIQRCSCVGFALDDGKNNAVNDVEGTVVEIGDGKEGMKTLVCRTDEQLEMAQQCVLRKQEGN